MIDPWLITLKLLVAPPVLPAVRRRVTLVEDVGDLGLGGAQRIGDLAWTVIEVIAP